MFKFIRQMSSKTKPIWCSNLPRSQYLSLEKMSIPNEQWFQVYRLRKNLFAIYEPFHWEESISYLIIGDKNSLLIDTGMGIGNIKNIVDYFIPKSKTIQVINTHTHHDHIGDNWRFQGKILGVDTKFSNENAQGSIIEAQNELKPGLIWEDFLPKDFIRENYQIHPFEITKYVKENDQIQLGENHYLKIISTPGHSPDSISILDEKERLLFIGDTFYQGPILLYRTETNLHDYLSSLEKLRQIINKFDLILPGHNVPNVNPNLLIQGANAMKDIINGKSISKKTNDGKYDEYSYEEFSFVIDPSFLK